jgi:two-component system, OmpR family, phosphate regulon sensor histidine kinase PhoR
MDMPTSIFRRFFKVYLTVLLCVAAGTAIITAYATRAIYHETIRTALLTQVRIIQLRLPDGRLEEHVDDIQDICFKMRDFLDFNVTVTRLNGDVIADTHVDAWKLINQINQPEFQQALERDDGTGFLLRPNPHTGGTSYYLTQRIYAHNEPLGFIRVNTPAAKTSSARFTVILITGLLVITGGLILSVTTVRTFRLPLDSMSGNAENLSENIDRKWHLLKSDIADIDRLNKSLEQMVANFKNTLMTERYQRRLLETMFRSMVDPVFVVDSREYILRYNDAVRTLFNTGIEEISGRSILEVIRNTSLHHFIRKTLSRTTPQEEDIVFHNHDDRYFKATGVSIDKGDGSIIGALIVLNNVTRIRRLERLRSDFVANVSHELKTPVTAIRGFVETLLDRSETYDNDTVRFLTIILKRAHQLHAVIEDLLCLSRLEQSGGEGVLKRQQVQLRDILDSAVSACKTIADERRVTLLTDSDAGTINVNRIMLIQAVFNLVDNAVKYGDKNSQVIIRGRIADRKLTIRVEDQGPGIPLEHHERIFERFYRLDKSRSRESGGSGLGLSIVKHIAQVHGGRVTLQSRPGDGSVFSIEIPDAIQQKLNKRRINP